MCPCILLLPQTKCQEVLIEITSIAETRVEKELDLHQEFIIRRAKGYLLVIVFDTVDQNCAHNEKIWPGNLHTDLKS